MALHCWNTDVSAALYVILQLCELSVRNGTVEAIEKVFGPNWHLNRGFGHTLPVLKGGKGYQPKADLRACASRLPTAGKVVAELKFAFWQYMFVQGQDKRIWLPHFALSFPGFDAKMTIEQARASVHDDIEKIRHLRNRIAHHEPIFARNLQEDRDRVLRLIAWRRPTVARWLANVESVTKLLAARP